MGIITICINRKWCPNNKLSLLKIAELYTRVFFSEKTLENKNHSILDLTFLVILVKYATFCGTLPR